MQVILNDFWQCNFCFTCDLSSIFFNEFISIFFKEKKGATNFLRVKNYNLFICN